METENTILTTLQDFLHRYEIDFTHSLDQKGLGSVYMGKDKENGQIIAIKSIEMYPIFDKGAVAARYQTAMELSHPNLLPYIAAYRFVEPDTIQNFVLMPYVAEGSLQALIPKLSYQQKIEIIDALVNVLSYLHENGHIWQNLRSDHLLIKKAQDILIPLCINYGEKGVLPQAFFVNYEYLAPEQLAVEGNFQISVQTDIWALGIFIYELFTGQLPFGKKTAQLPNQKIQERILQDEIPGLKENLPSTYRSIVEKCLQKNPENRWADVAEIKTYISEHPKKPIVKEIGILETLEKMGADAPETPDNLKKTDKVPFLQRTIRRKPSRPVSWLEVILWLGLAILVGYLLSRLV